MLASLPETVRVLPLKGDRLIASLNDRSPTDPLAGRRLHKYSSRDEIPLLAEGFWQLTEGLVQLSVNFPDGEQGILGWVKPGGFFGEGLSRVQNQQAVAITNSRARWISMDELNNNPQLPQLLVPQLIARLQQTEMLVSSLGRHKVEDRLQALFLLLKRDLGVPTSGGTRISHRLTHQQLANAIGTTRVTMTRLLGRLKAEGWLDIDSTRHIVLDEGKFSTITDF
jgi:CRP-like cAMP-binding protein